MSEQKHTPGPWHRNIRPARKYPTIWAGRNVHIAAVVPGAPWGSGNGATMSDDEPEANIDLIAAAPDLLAAVKALLKLHEAHHNEPLHAQAREIVSKAEPTP